MISESPSCGTYIGEDSEGNTCAIYAISVPTQEDPVPALALSTGTPLIYVEKGHYLTADYRRLDIYCEDRGAP